MLSSVQQKLFYCLSQSDIAHDTFLFLGVADLRGVWLVLFINQSILWLNHNTDGTYDSNRKNVLEVTKFDFLGALSHNTVTVINILSKLYNVFRSNTRKFCHAHFWRILKFRKSGSKHENFCTILLKFYLNNNQPENEVLPPPPLWIGPRVAWLVLMKIWSPTYTSDTTTVLLQW